MSVENQQQPIVITELGLSVLEKKRERITNLRDYAWAEIQNKLPDHSVELENVLHVAGGGLPLVFGDEQNEVWQKIAKSADSEGNVIIAGIKFSLKELSLIGEFYKFAKGLGYNFHCVDERLDEQHERKDSYIHEQCGACGAVQRLIQQSVGGVDLQVDDYLVETLNQPGKQGLLASQGLLANTETTHSSSTYMVTFANHARVMKSGTIDALRDAGALAMNITIPLGLINEFYKEKSKTDSPLASENVVCELLQRWNIGISRAVIGSTHNDQRDLIGRELLISNFANGADDNTARRVNSDIRTQLQSGISNPKIRNLTFSSE